MNAEQRAGGIFVLASLCGLAVAALASVLYNSDTMLPLAICLAVGAALELQLRAGAPTSPSAEDVGS